MRKVTLCLVLLTTLLEASNNPYDNPLTTEYKELFAEFRGFVVKILLANLERKVKVRFMPSQTSCVNRCNEKRSKTFYCHCDDNCQLYGDCCYDYWGKCNQNKTVKQSEQDRWKCISDLHRQHVKLFWYDYPFEYPRIKGHMMISTCQNSSTEIKNKCLNPNHNTTLGQVPVEGSDNVTYRNRYCAFCNGNTPKNITNWRYNLICTLTSPSQKINETLRLNRCVTNKNLTCNEEAKEYIENNCTWYYTPPTNLSKSHTICSPVEVCPQTPVINVTASKYRELTLKCQAYMKIVYREGSYYKNPHCALCHGVDPLQLEVFPPPVHMPTISIFFEIPQPRFQSNDNSSDIMASRTKQLPGEQYLHLVGVTVSTVTLILLLILYSLVKPLRTTPGKIIICLSISILVYQAIMIASPSLSKKAVSCSIGAIFLHFVILSSFAWMTVMSYDVWKTFGKNATALKKKKSTFQSYVLYSVVSPLVLVVTGIVVDQAGVMTVYMRSNEMDSSNGCWIVDSLSNLLFFKIPVGLTLGFNVICLIWAVIGITKVEKETRMVQNPDRPSKYTNNIKLKIYVKLSIVMGITWILGYTIEYSTIARYLYVLLNTFQGFFIFLAFVTNKRVLQKCKDSRISRNTLVTWINVRKTSYATTKY